MFYRGKKDSKDEAYSERSLTFARRYKNSPVEDIKRDTDSLLSTMTNQNHIHKGFSSTAC
jgi:hypothetical protein